MRPRTTDFWDDPLPLPYEHWVARRKARVVIAILNNEITLADAAQRYGLTKGEFLSWLTAYEKYGVAGLRVTRTQIYGDLRREVPSGAG